MPETRYFHLAYYGYEQTVIDSQLVAPARLLAGDGFPVHAVFLEGPRSWLRGDWKPRQTALTALGLESTFLPRAPRNVFGLNTLLLESRLASALKAGRVVVHARGLQGAHALLPLRRKYSGMRLLCDVRGLEAAEYELDIRIRKGRPARGVEAWWARRLRDIEREAIRGSDGVLCVSRSMIPMLSRRAGVDAGRFDYVPCAVETDGFAAALAGREAMRGSLGFAGKRVVLYAGSLSAWQIPEVIVRVAGRALALDPGAVFFGLTPEPERLAALARRAGLPADRVVCRRVAHRDMASHLAVGDVGLLLREDNEVNRFACPTKFAEYLACGLHVLATGAVDEVAATLGATGAGTLLETTAPGDALDRGIARALSEAGASGRSEKSVEAARLYDWSRHLPTLKKWYRQLAS